jgi:hypothetical protein
MTKARLLMIGTAIATLSATGAYAQTAAQPAQMQMQAPTQTQMQAPDASTGGAPGVTPPQQRMVAPAPTDPLVQKRNATAEANAEYRASKKASKAELKASKQQANAQYKEQVKNAKINRKADKDAAKAELNATAPSAPKDTGLQH